MCVVVIVGHVFAAPCWVYVSNCRGMPCVVSCCWVYISNCKGMSYDYIVVG